MSPSNTQAQGPRGFDGRHGRFVVAVDGAQLACTTRGKGPVCFVLSAMGTTPYERQMPASLSDRLQLVFVDLRGGGRSTGDPADLTFDQLAADLDAIRAHLDVAKVAVIGHSILGALALEYGRRCSDSVSHVVTVGTPPRGDMAWLAATADEFFERDASDERKAILRENLAQLPPGAPPDRAFLAQAPTRCFDPRTDMAPLYEGAVMKPALLMHLLGPLTHDWNVADLSGVASVPVLLAHGRYDYTVPHVLCEDLERALPTATRHLFARSGHQPFYEEPHEFTTTVLRWMDEHAAA